MILSEAKQEDLNRVDASGWSRAMDAQLLAARGERGLPWSAFSIFTPDGRKVSERKCQKRFALLTREEGRPAPTTAARKAEADGGRDGLEWLARKGRLSARRKAAAYAYRAAYRDASGPSLKSCLEGGLGGGFAPGDVAQADLAAMAQAKRRLFAFRWLALGGQDDLVTVMDGVCGVGHTLRELAGGGSDDQVKARARVLEAVLMVALDLIARQADGG
ncbi:hypothetical protein [Phenylobacterium sp.]|uniref:hypothetical protein n=1 Tax=Phenylobacterium sp. TaxID=1871053 RepID=UPI00391B0588